MKITTEAIITMLIGVALATISYGLGLSFGWITAADLNLLEIVGVVFNYSCVILCARQNILNWPIGLVATLLLGAFFWQIQLYSSMVLMLVYFAPIQFWGWYNWKYGGFTLGTELPVTKMTSTQVMTLIAMTPFVFLLVSGINLHFGGASPFLDTGILVMSILAQQLMTSKKVESWHIWIIVNILSTIVYFKAGAMILGVQYVLFLGNAVYGLYKWQNARDLGAELISRSKLVSIKRGL